MNRVEELLQQIGVHPEATSWLSLVWDCIQGLDDWVDNDEVTRREKELVIYKALVLLPSHPFFLTYNQHLTPVLSNAVLKWVGANSIEESGEASVKSFMWRASYYDLVLETIRVAHGVEAAMNAAPVVANLYGEKYTEYLKEFENA